MWYSIHFIALDYPEKPSAEQRTAYKSFFENLGKIIPCYKCGQNYKRHLEELPLEGPMGDYLENRDSLFAWTVELHNTVNKELGKPVMTISDALRKYTSPDFCDDRCPIPGASAPAGGKSMSSGAGNSDTEEKNKKMYYVIGGVVVAAVVLLAIAAFARNGGGRKRASFLR